MAVACAPSAVKPAAPASVTQHIAPIEDSGEAVVSIEGIVESIGEGKIVVAGKTVSATDELTANIEVGDTVSVTVSEAADGVLVASELVSLNGLTGGSISGIAGNDVNVNGNDNMNSNDNLNSNDDNDNANDDDDDDTNDTTMTT
jgi:hypothetical protein